MIRIYVKIHLYTCLYRAYISVWVFSTTECTCVFFMRVSHTGGFVFVKMHKEKNTSVNDENVEEMEF